MGVHRDHCDGFTAMRPFEAEVAQLWDAGLSHADIARETHKELATVETVIKRVVDNRDPEGYRDRVRAQSAALLTKLREVFPQYCGAPADGRHHAA